MHAEGARQLELFATKSRFLRPGSMFPRKTLNHIGEISALNGDSAEKHGIRYEWPKYNDYGGGFLEFDFRGPNDVCPAVGAGKLVILSNLQINKRSNRLEDGTKEGLLAFITMIATIEQIASLLPANSLGLFHVERATKYSLRLFLEQVQLGNYQEISKEDSGFELYYQGYFMAEYPFKDASLKEFALKEVVEWGRQYVK